MPTGSSACTQYWPGHSQSIESIKQAGAVCANAQSGMSMQSSRAQCLGAKLERPWALGPAYRWLLVAWHIFSQLDRPTFPPVPVMSKAGLSVTKQNRNSEFSLHSYQGIISPLQTSMLWHQDTQESLLILASSVSMRMRTVSLFTERIRSSHGGLLTCSSADL